MAAAITAPSKTTASNAAAAAEENRKKQEDEAKKRKSEKAKLKPRKESPLTVRSRKYNLRDPDTGKHLPAGEMVTLPFAGGWLRSQCAADLIEVIDGDINAPVEDADPAPPEAPPEVPPEAPKQEAGESDEAFKKRMSEFEASQKK